VRERESSVQKTTTKEGRNKRKEKNHAKQRDREKKKLGIATLTNTFAPLLLAKAYLLQLRVFNAHQTYV